MKAAHFFLFVALTATSLAAEPHRAPAKVLIQDMADDLDTLIRAAIYEKGSGVQVVVDAADADFVLTGLAPEQHERNWREGWLPSLKKGSAPTISLVSRDGEFVWAMEVPEQNRLWGSFKRDGRHKTAEKIASELLVAVEAIRVSP